MEGDPPEIEEDKDFYEADDFEGIIIYVVVVFYFSLQFNQFKGLFTSNRSLVLQLLSQIRIGMDLTRFMLPIFIFEKRSLLELYSEFFSHPDIVLR